MELERSQFTFYASIFEAISRIKRKADRADAYDAVCLYALNGTAPDLDTMSDAAAIAFISARPNLDASRRKASNGKTGGTRKHTGSKPETYRKQEQTEREKEGEKEKEGEVEIENECYIESANADSSAGAKNKEPAFIALPLNDGTEYGIPESQVKKWQSLYPSVDIRQQLRNMRGWLDANPAKRKTRRGINAFCVMWLSKEQDRGTAAPRAPAYPRKAPVPMGCGELGDAELEAIQRVLGDDPGGKK